MSMVWITSLPRLRFDWTYMFVWDRITLNGLRRSIWVQVFLAVFLSGSLVMS